MESFVSHIGMPLVCRFVDASYEAGKHADLKEFRQLDLTKPGRAAATAQLSVGSQVCWAWISTI